MQPTVKQHAFEKAGLGLAPFRFVGMEVKVGPIVTGMMSVGAPGQPMGCCQYCSTGIKYCYWVKSADGKTFYVGSECIRKSGDSGLTALVSKEEAKIRKTTNEARRVKTQDKTEAAIRAAMALLDSNPTLQASLEATKEFARYGSDASYIEWCRCHAGLATLLFVSKKIAERHERLTVNA